jgi:PAS domain S-box-containing protein
MTADNALVMVATHDQRLVVLSVVISILAAYAARELSGRIIEARPGSWSAWLVGAATVDGIGTWSMHHTGILALQLPVPLQFDWRMVLLSLLVAILGSGAAFTVATRRKAGWGRALVAGIVLGAVGISGLHYVAMAAIRVPDAHHYFPLTTVLAIVLAMVFSFLALAPSFLHERWAAPGLRKHAAALLRGSANPVMHYTAMSGMMFAQSGAVPDVSHAIGIETIGVLGVCIVPVMVLVVALLSAFVDRLQRQRALLDELFEQGPAAVALMSAQHEVVRVNRAFSRIFGYSPKEARGRRLGELIAADARDNEEGQPNMLAPGQRLDIESVRRRKDGSTLDVSMVQVPVALPRGQVEIYAMFRDITEQKIAEEELRDSEAHLRQALAERERLSRDLHDHVLQAIYAVGMRLEETQRQGPPELAAQLGDIIASLNTVIRDIRGYISGSPAPILTHPQFRAELEKLIEIAEGFSGPRFELDADPSAFAQLTAAQAEQVLHIAREAVSNSMRHSQAVHGKLGLRAVNGGVMLDIADNGVGFDRNARGMEGSGLRNIRSRARQLGARLEISSTPGGGTRIAIYISTRTNAGS